MKKQTLILSLIAIMLMSIITSLFIMVNDKQNKSIPKNKVERNTLDYFNEIAFGFEYENDKQEISPILKKWEKRVVGISFNGNKMNPYLDGCLENVIADFNTLSATTKLRLGFQGDIDFYLIPVEQFSKFVPNYTSGNDGYFYVEFNESNAITHSIILINSNDISRDVERCHLIREELTQSMGFPMDSDKYEDSMFYAPWTTTLGYSQLDEKVIKVLYGGQLKSGMTKQEVNNSFIVD